MLSSNIQFIMANLIYITLEITSAIIIQHIQLVDLFIYNIYQIQSYFKLHNKDCFFAPSKPPLEGSEKKALLIQLNDANGCGTPSISTQKRRRGDASSRLKSLLTPKSKSSALKSQKKEGKNHGSYNIDTRAKKFDESEATPSYKRQDSRGNSSSLVTFTSDASPLLKDGPTDQR